MAPTVQHARTPDEIRRYGCFKCRGPHYRRYCPQLLGQSAQVQAAQSQQRPASRAPQRQQGEQPRSYAAAAGAGRAPPLPEEKTAVCNCDCKEKVALLQEAFNALELKVRVLESTRATPAAPSPLRAAAAPFTPKASSKVQVVTEPTSQSLSLVPVSEAESKEEKRVGAVARSTAISLVSPRSKSSPVAAPAVSTAVLPSSSTVEPSMSRNASLVAAAAATPIRPPVTPSKRAREPSDPFEAAGAAIVLESPTKRRSSSTPSSPRIPAPVPVASPAGDRKQSEVTRTPPRSRAKSISIPPSPFDEPKDHELIHAFDHLPSNRSVPQMKLINALLQREAKLLTMEEQGTLTPEAEDELRKVETQLLTFSKNIQGDAQCRKSVREFRARQQRHAAKFQQYAEGLRASGANASSASVGATSVVGSSLSSSVAPSAVADASAASASPSSK